MRQRIQAELAKLQAEEEVVKSALRAALERENLARERNFTGTSRLLSTRCTIYRVKYMAGESKVDGDSEVTNAGSRGTASLHEDIEAIKRRVERYSQRKQLGTGADSAVEASRQAVVKCYRENAERPLDCWKQVEEFKQQVASIETVRTSPFSFNLFLTPCIRNS